MLSQLLHVAILVASLPPVLARPTVNQPYNFDSFTPADTITRDVAIIGGGSAGTFSAISLKDEGKSIVVVETKGRLGGHTETYTDPENNNTIDMGVVIFHNTTTVRDYFARFNVPLIVSGSDVPPTERSSDVTYDLNTGQKVTITRNQTEVSLAFQKYAQILQQYPRLADGMFLPDPVPEDLVMPFRQFAQKYGIEAVLPTMYQYNAGLGDIFTIPTVENMRIWGLGLVAQLQTGFLTTARHNNSELYGKAQAELLNADSLLLQSEVVYSDRNSPEVQLVVNTPTGQKLIKAKKLLITIPPKVDLLTPFDLSAQEETVFGKFLNTGYYTSVINNTGIPDNLSVTNWSPDLPYNIPNVPAVYSIGSAIKTPGLRPAFYGTPVSNTTYEFSDQAVKDAIIGAVKNLQAANPTTFVQTEPYFVAYSAHTPFYLQATSADIKAGFYEDLYALQGLRNTYWTGATWRAQDSSEIWKFTQEQVLPKLLEGL